mgnify:CR=1 FL=1
MNPTSPTTANPAGPACAGTRLGSLCFSAVSQKLLTFAELDDYCASLKMKVPGLGEYRHAMPHAPAGLFPSGQSIWMSDAWQYNRNLNEMVQRNEFREDLLYRINTIHLEIPPLRERPEDIEPFMLRNRVIGAETFDDAPQVVKSVGERVAFSQSDAIYAVGVKPAMGKVFQIFRKGRELRDPAIAPRPWYRWHHANPDPQIIGYEASYLGDARLLREGEVARLEIVSSKQEVQIGDYLIPAPPVETMAWVPHAPEVKVEGFVMTLPNGVSEAGKTNVVTLNLGKRHGLEVGHVLAVYKSAETFANPRYKEHPMNWVPGWPKISGSEPVTLQIPEERIALVFVFTVFDGVSYGMVMNSGVDNVRAGYPVRNP